MTQLDWIGDLKKSIVLSQRYHVAAFVRDIERKYLDIPNAPVDIEFLLEMVNVFEHQKFYEFHLPSDPVSDPIIKESLNSLKSYIRELKINDIES